jgi:23S rRNA (cytidine2498-2'-O)-methyltransferase
VTPLLAAIDALAQAPPHVPPWRDAWVEHPDTNEGKALSPLARAIAARVEGALRERGALDPRSGRRLHAFLGDGGTAWIGTSDAQRGSRWPLGIPRLHMPGGAPSRSTLKLAEAFVVFLGEDANTLLRPGMRAVDLGAAPGGWTWQLVQRGLRVTAVDNGALKGPVASDPFVTHVRADGLSWRPRKPVDWMVCDIVLAPSRIAELCARWIADGAARRAIFNLKLPMKRRADAVRDARARIASTLDVAGVRYELSVRQLYHDREEVTAYLARRD